ncbi:FAD binding domain-containing protein [Candidatus Fermentibacteria bacterium]|nr:FAD binding domain-containing protein [Candidatus Fermentibacteria bacterium]
MSQILPSLERYHRPASLDEALRILHEGGASVMVLAGGVSLGMVPRRAVRGVVSIERLGLDAVEREGGTLRIGAGVTLGHLERMLAGDSPVERLLMVTVRRTATTPLRNLITAGGVIAGVGPWSDLPVALLALGADIVLNGTTVISIERFLADGPRSIAGAIISEIRMSVDGVKGGAFIKLGRNETDLAMASASVVVFDDGVQPRVRVAIGGLVSRPLRIEAVEESLTRGVIDRGALSELLGSLVTPRHDPRAEAVYRLDLAGTCVMDCFETATREASA